MADEILDGADMIGQLLEKASVSRTSRETLAFFQFLRNVRHQNASEQAELILQASLDPTTASRARKGDSVNLLGAGSTPGSLDRRRDASDEAQLDDA